MRYLCYTLLIIGLLLSYGYSLEYYKESTLDNGNIWVAEAFGTRARWYRSSDKPYMVEWIVIRTSDGRSHRLINKELL